MCPRRLLLAYAIFAAIVPSFAGADEPPAAADPAPLGKPPRLLRFVHAETPASLAERGTVEVKLDIIVDEKGKVQSVSVAESGGAEYDEAARAAALQFEFAPGEVNGKPVPVRILYTYRFVMKSQPPPASVDGGTPPADGAPPPPADGSTPDGGVPATTDHADAPPAGVAPPPAPTAARPGTVSVPFAGRVLRKGDRVPVVGATVILDDSETLAVTDAEGRFSFDTVPVGKHVVKVRGPGIDAVNSDEALTPGKRLEVTYYVSAKVRYRSTVRAARPVREAVEQTLAIDEIKRIPGTQGDTLKAVQNLPGVARAAFGGGQLIVWGSSPHDTRVYVDGVAIPTLYHFGGLRSTVNGEIVSDLTFTPGGYGAQYGRGLGGLVEITTRPPRTDGYHGFVQLDVIDGSFLVEGPITKNLSFGVSARRSWIDVFMPLLTTNDFQLSPKYWDYQARLRWKASPRDDVNVLFFGSDDSLQLLAKQPDPKLSASIDTHTYYHRALGSWTHRFDRGGVLSVTGATGYSVPFKVNVAVGSYNLSVDTQRVPYELRAVFRQPLGKNLRVDAGLDFEGSRWGITSSTASGPPGEASPPSMALNPASLQGSGTIYQNALAPWVAGLFTDDDKRFELTLGLRLDSYFTNGSYDFPGAPESLAQYRHVELGTAYFAPEARLALRYQVRPWMWVKAAFGYYHQAPLVSALYGPFGNVALRPEEAQHYVAGFDFKPTATLTISTEGFFKTLSNLVVPGEGDGAPPQVNEGVGRVYGGELLVRQQLWKGLFGWVSYTISRAERRDHPGADWRLFQYDQTHILTLLASYQFGRGYQVGLRFRYVTGNPITPYLGSYTDLNSGNFVPIYGPLYSERLDAFNQLDLRFDKTWEFKLWKFGVYLDVQNVYYAKNPEGLQPNYDFTQTKPLAGLPIVPALGVRGDF